MKLTLSNSIIKYNFQLHNHNKPPTAAHNTKQPPACGFPPGSTIPGRGGGALQIFQPGRNRAYSGAEGRPTEMNRLSDTFLSTHCEPTRVARRGCFSRRPPTSGEQIPGEDSAVVRTTSMVALNHFRNNQPGRSQHQYSHIGLRGHAATVESPLTVDTFL